MDEQLTLDGFVPPEWKGLGKYLKGYNRAKARENSAKMDRQTAEFKLKEAVKDYCKKKRLKQLAVRCDKFDVLVSEAKEVVVVRPVKTSKAVDNPSKDEIRLLAAH